MIPAYRKPVRFLAHGDGGWLGQLLWPCLAKGVQSDIIDGLMAGHPELVEGHPELVAGHPELVAGHPKLVEG